MYKSFNTPDTLGVISSYPLKNGEIAHDNAISRYTYLLTNSFPKNQKVIVFCELRKSNKPFLEAPNILVVPTYKINSLTFFIDVLKKISEFDAIKNILIQFEFSIFGGKVVIPQMVALLSTLKLLGKSTNIMFHQVVADINVLSGHLALKKGGVKAETLNLLLKLFYIACGLLVNKVFVHDNVLAGRISEFVDKLRISVIPHAVSQEAKVSKSFIKNSRKYFDVKNGTHLIGLFGYCSWYKGTDWLIENFARFVRENANLKIRLLVAGGESPTLKGTLAYQKYHQKLQKVIGEANGNIIYTGYVPDKDVKKVFAATELFVFPYRTKMSASGAFSLCLGYKKPYLVSKAFSENISNAETKDKTFTMDYRSFADLLNKNIRVGRAISPDFQGKSWKNVALMYLTECLSDNQLMPKLNYAQAI
jgi:glycosyltransferase involved in cell wall biosynthesis